MFTHFSLFVLFTLSVPFIKIFFSPHLFRLGTRNWSFCHWGDSWLWSAPTGTFGEFVLPLFHLLQAVVAVILQSLSCHLKIYSTSINFHSMVHWFTFLSNICLAKFNTLLASMSPRSMTAAAAAAAAADVIILITIIIIKWVAASFLLLQFSVK